MNQYVQNIQIYRQSNWMFTILISIYDIFTKSNNKKKKLL